MMKSFFETHKKLCLIIGGILGSLLLIVYLYAVFRPGLWYGDTFLSKQADGSFAGSDSYANYQMTVAQQENGSRILFSVNDIQKDYQLVCSENLTFVQVFEDGSLVLDGYTVNFSDEYLLLNEGESPSDYVQIYTNDETPSAEELFPSYSWLYNHSIIKKIDTQGEPALLLLVGFFVLIFVLDIRYPDLFFTLRYRHYVDGGEPNEWYRTSQQISRVILIIAILFCIGRSLFPIS